MIEDVKFNSKYDSFQSIPNIEELQYYTVESKCHAFIQLNEATKETLSLFNEGKFNDGRCSIKAQLHERKTLLSLVDNLDKFNIDILDEFIKNSANELQRDFN
jgi:hypothetical protein